MEEEMMTVKEWAEKAGIKLVNYDGFTSIYSKLTDNESSNFLEDTFARFRDAGELYCTRRGFEACVSGCTMYFPQESDYERIGEIFPNFIENCINHRISALSAGIKNTKIDKKLVKECVEELLKMLRYKSAIRENNIKLNGNGKSVNISEIDATDLGERRASIIKKHSGTVEELEETLINQIMTKLENMLQKKKPKQSEIPFDEIETAVLLSCKSARTMQDKPIEEEFMNVEFLGQQKEPMVLNYNIIGGEDIRSGVIFDVPTENGRVAGAVSKQQEDNNNSTDETDRAIQVIDSRVQPEERKGFMEKIKGFMKKVLDKINGRDEER